MYRCEWRYFNSSLLHEKATASLDLSEQIAEMELLIATAVEDLVALLGADGADKAEEIFAGMVKVGSPDALDRAEGGSGGGGGSSLSARAPEGFRIRAGEVGMACWDPLIEIAEETRSEIAAEAVTSAASRRSGEHRHRGRRDFEFLQQQRSHRGVQQDENAAKEIEAKAKFEVDALDSAICSLRAAILARSELVKEAEDSAAVADAGENKLDGVVQTVLRKHGINVQRYWNGAVSFLFFILKLSLLTSKFFSACRSRLSALPRPL